MSTQTKPTEAEAIAQATSDVRNGFVGNRFERIQLAAFDLQKAAGFSDADAERGAEQVGSFCGLHFPSSEVEDITTSSKGVTVWLKGEKRTKLPVSGASILLHRAFAYQKLVSLGVSVTTAKFRD